MPRPRHPSPSPPCRAVVLQADTTVAAPAAPRRRSPSPPRRRAPALTGSVAGLGRRRRRDVGARRASRGASSARTSGRRSAPPKTPTRACSTTSDGLADGTLVEYRAVSTDAAGHRSAASTYALGRQRRRRSSCRRSPSRRSDLGRPCPAASTPRWAAPATGSPACDDGAADAARRRHLDAARSTCPPASYEYKVAIDGSVGR